MSGALHSQQPRATQLLPVAIIILLIWFGFHLWSMTRYPAITCDEGFYVQSALGYLDGSLAASSGRSAGLAFYLPHGRAYWAVIGLSARLFGTSLFSIRLTSVFGWLGLSLSTFMLGKRFLKDQNLAGIAALLVATSVVNMFVGHIVRPDIYGAACIAAVIAALPAVQRRNSPLLYALYGLSLSLPLDFHFNTVHFVWFIALSEMIRLARRRSGTQLALFMLGGVAGIICLVGLHAGPILPQLIERAIADPAGFSASYLSGGDQPPFLTEAAFRIRSFIAYWWQYYAGYIPLGLIPQGLLFALSTIAALIKAEQPIKQIAWIIAASSITFGLVNARYQLVGYSVLWFPLYAILGVWAVWWLGKALPERAGKQRWLELAIVSLLLTINVAASLYLARQPLNDPLFASAESIREEVPAGSEVIMPITWWPLIYEDYVFIDEHSITNFERVVDGERTFDNVFWLAATDTVGRRINAGFIESIDPTLTSEDQIYILLNDGLQPDYVLLDATLGCEASTTRYAEAYEAVITNTCEPLDLDLPSEQAGRLYSCPWK